MGHVTLLFFLCIMLHLPMLLQLLQNVLRHKYGVAIHLKLLDIRNIDIAIKIFHVEIVVAVNKTTTGTPASLDSGSKEYGTKDSEVISMAPAMIVGSCSRSSSVVISMESAGANSSDVTESAAASMERRSSERGVGEEAASTA